MNASPHRARKRYGQHFLHDKNIIQKIIDAVDPAKETPIVEIGPGKGALTIPLLQRMDELDVVEIDRDLAHNLVERCQAYGRLHIHQSDALLFDFASLYDHPVKIVGNLPYNISTPLLFRLLDQITCIEEMVFMLQKEVVKRICAEPDTKSYGRLSVMVQSQCQIEDLFTIGPNAFTPRPKVDSAVIRLRPEPSRTANLSDPVLFRQLVKDAFNYRRKTLRNALKSSVTEDMFEEAEIASTFRAENLSIEQYITLSNVVHSHKNQ